jgi:hypothetical protein
MYATSSLDPLQANDGGGILDLKFDSPIFAQRSFAMMMSSGETTEAPRHRFQSFGVARTLLHGTHQTEE